MSFYMAGISLTMAGAINIPLRRLAAWQKRKKQGFQDDNPNHISLIVTEGQNGEAAAC